MPFVFDNNFLEDKRVSKVSGLMLNKFQRGYISQFDEKTQQEFYLALDNGKIGKLPENIPHDLH